jgi:hypothetical protein
LIISSENKIVANKLSPMEQKGINKVLKVKFFLNNPDFIKQAIRDKIKEYK